MKVRNSFVTNSSSSSFLITNVSDEPKKITDFIKLIEDDIRKEYHERRDIWEEDGKDNWFTNTYPTFKEYFEKALKDAEKLYDKELEPNEDIVKECGDHQDDDGLAEYFIHAHNWLDSDYSRDFYIIEIESHH